MSMDYIDKWEKMKEIEKSLTHKKCEFIHIRSSVSNSDGYKINVNHSKVKPVWETFCKKNGVSRYGMTVFLRREFEEHFMKSRTYRTCVEQEKKLYGENYNYFNFKAG